MDGWMDGWMDIGPYEKVWDRRTCFKKGKKELMDCKKEKDKKHSFHHGYDDATVIPLSS